MRRNLRSIAPISLIAVILLWIVRSGDNQPGVAFQVDCGPRLEGIFIFYTIL